MSSFGAKIGLVLMLFATATWASSPLRAIDVDPSRDALGLGTSRLRILANPTIEMLEGVGATSRGFLERRFTVPLLGECILRPGRLPISARDRLIQAGRLWEKIPNGFQGWTSLYRRSIQLVLTLD